MPQRLSGYVRDETGRRVEGQEMRPGPFDLNEARFRPADYDPGRALREEMRHNMRSFGVPEGDIERRIEENMMNLRRRITG